ncbi:MAG: YrhK family protein, partial [Acidaminobacteraceae bacterium]
MPHSFSENKILKKGSPTTKLELKSLVLIKETFVDWVYLIGGVTFVIGSIFFLPKMETYGDTGAWIFIFGSLMYLAVTGYELTMSIKLIRKNKVNTVWAHLEFSSTLIYLIGAASYLFASILFLSEINQVFEGAISFIIGSLLFLVGASINVIEITNASSTESLQLMNGAAIMYISGSLLFLVASIP